MEELTARLCRTLLPRRRPNGHKGTFGKVAVVGGAVGSRRPSGLRKTR